MSAVLQFPVGFANRVMKAMGVLVLLMGLSACQVLQDSGVVQKPQVSLSDLSVRALSVEGVTFDVLMRVDNPNPVALKLTGLDYDFKVAGQSVASSKVPGEQGADLQLAAGGQSQLKIPIQLKFGALRKIVTDLDDQGAIDYALTANAKIDLPVLGPFPITATKTGVLPLPRMPQVSLSSLTVESLGLAGADLSMVLRVINPNSFGVEVSHLKSVLEVDGVDWINTMLSETLSLSAGKSEQVVLPIRLDFLQLGAQLMSRLQGSQPFQYALSGNFLLETDLPMLQRLNLPYKVGGQIPLR